MSKETYKLIYFTLKGRAEVSRVLFFLGNQEYEDFHIKLEEWPLWKEKMPFLQAPVLEITRENGEKLELAQTNAIERFLANKFNLYGKNEWERARIDMIVEHIIDLHTAIVSLYFKPDSDERKKEFEKVYTEKAPAHLKLLEKLYHANQSQSGNSGYLVGDQLSYADVKLVDMYDWLRDQRESVLDKVPGLKEHFNKIRNLPKLKENYEKSDKMRLTVMF